MALGFPHSGEVPILEPWICHSSRPGSRGGPPGPAKLWPSGNQWGAFAWGRTDTNPISRQQNVGNSPIFPPSSSNLGLEGYVFQFFGTGEFFSILQLCPCRDPIGHLRFISAMCEQWRVRPKWCQQKIKHGPWLSGLSLCLPRSPLGRLSVVGYHFRNLSPSSHTPIAKHHGNRWVNPTKPHSFHKNPWKTQTYFNVVVPIKDSLSLDK